MTIDFFHHYVTVMHSVLLPTEKSLIWLMHRDT